MGKAAIAANEKACIQLATASDGLGKIDYSLHSLLSLLSTFPHRDEWRLTLVCSNHRADVYSDILKQKMNGLHCAKLAGKDSAVIVEVVGVVDEATHYKPKSGDETVLIDFGGGTTIYVKYSAELMNSSGLSTAVVKPILYCTKTVADI
jgi:hypothetical protein